MPITGWLYSSADAVRIEWFNLFAVPDLVAPNEELAGPIEEIHETLAKVLMAIALLHIAAGLKHGFVDKDATLRRISSKASIGLFVVIIILGATLLV
jgi:cytochrome b561